MNGKQYLITAILNIPQAVTEEMQVELNQHYTGHDHAPQAPSQELMQAHYAIHRSTHVGLQLELQPDGSFTASLPRDAAKARMIVLLADAIAGLKRYGHCDADCTRQNMKGPCSCGFCRFADEGGLFDIAGSR